MTTSSPRLVLLPDDTYARRVIDFSASLDELTPSEVCLGEATVLPHVTVLDADTSAERFASLLRHVTARPLQATTTAFYLRPSGDATWVGLVVQKSDALRAFHQAVAEACQAANVATDTSTSEYWPHLTLGRWIDIPHAQLPARDAPYATFDVTPAIAKTGPHGTVLEVLHTPYG
jgi:2'-5' RNA ligase